MRWIISPGPILRDFNLLYSFTENLSFVKMTQTRSLGWKFTSRRCLSTTCLYVSADVSKLCHACWWTSCNSSTKSIAWPWRQDLSGDVIKSKGLRGRMPYITLKGLNPKLRLWAWLWANHAGGNLASHDLILSPTRLHNMFPKARLVTSVWPSIWGW